MSVAAAQPPEREEEELRAYLGDAYDRARLERSEEVMAAELDRLGDEDRLYRVSEGYLYDLTRFAMTGTKHPYLELLVEAVPPPARLLDFGCGIGSDGLALLELGYDVAFADFDNPSTRYLRWRLGRRGRRAEIFDLDAGDPPGGFDVAFAFDVIEHVDDPVAFLARMERLSRLIMVNLLAEEDEIGLHHRELPVRALVRRSARRRLLRYRIFHGRSHVVLYAPERARGAQLARSWATWQAGRARARLG